MEYILNIFGTMSTIGIIISVALVIIFVLAAWTMFRGKKSTGPPAVIPVPERITENEKETVATTLHTGTFNCMCFRQVKHKAVIDFTVIPEPIGEMYPFDQSCPLSGDGYIVKEDKDGNIIDYDPRDKEYKVMESPEIAWFAINWSIVKEVFYSPIGMLRSPAFWMAGAMMAITFILFLAVLG